MGTFEFSIYIFNPALPGEKKAKRNISNTVCISVYFPQKAQKLGLRLLFVCIDVDVCVSAA